MLLVDGAKYNLWIPENEEQFENMIKEHAKEIFGEDSLYFGIKRKIVSRTGIGSIPDGYLIRFDPVEWYLVEAELSSHSHEHVVMQLNRFMRGIRNFENQREIVEAMYNEIKSNPSMKETIRVKSNFDDPHHFLSNTVSRPPGILIAIEQEDIDIREACQDLKVVPRIIVFQTLVKEGANIQNHAHFFEPLYPIMLPSTEPEGEGRKFLSRCKKCGMTFVVDRSAMHRPSDDPRVAHQKTHGYDSTLLEDRFETVSAKRAHVMQVPGAKEKVLSRTQEEYRDFYQELVQLVRGKIPATLPEISPRSYYQIPTGISGVHFEWVFHGRPRSSFGVELHFEKGNGETNKSLLQEMKKSKQEIEKETGEKVVFQDSWGKAWSRLYLEKNEGRMTDELRKWAVEKMETLYNLLQPRLLALK